MEKILQKELKKQEQRNEKELAWVLVIQLITYISNDEKALLKDTCKKIKNCKYLKKDADFMARFEKGFSKRDLEYLDEVKKKLQPQNW